jgi:hypothetical protein
MNVPNHATTPAPIAAKKEQVAAMAVINAARAVIKNVKSTSFMI